MVSTRAKDCYKFLTTVNSFTDGQVQVSDWDSDFLSWILLDVVPSQGPYRGAKFKFRVRIFDLCILIITLFSSTHRIKIPNI